MAALQSGKHVLGEKPAASGSAELAELLATARANGALVDIGVYCVQLMVALFGRPESLQSAGILLENGLDGQGMILAKCPGMLAELSYSKICDAAAPSTI